MQDKREVKPKAAFPIIKRNNCPVNPALEYARREHYRAAFKLCRPIFDKLVRLSRKRMEIPAEFFAETRFKAYAVLWLAETPRRHILEPEGAAWFPTFNADPGPKHPIQRIGIDKRTGNLIYGVQAIGRIDAADYEKAPAWRNRRFWTGPHVESVYKLMPLSEVESVEGEIISLDANWLALIETRLNEFLLFLKDGEELTAQEILGASNQEIRRALIMKAGYERVKELMHVEVIAQDYKSDAELIHIRDDGQNRESDDDRRKLAFLKVRDSSTDRLYLLAVPVRWRGVEIETVQMARAWTFGFMPHDARDFDPLIET